MPRGNGRIKPKQSNGLLDETSLKTFRSDFNSFLALPPPFHKRLERLSAEAKPDREEIVRAYRAMPNAAARVLSYILSLDADDFSSLRKQLRAHAKDLDYIRERFDPLARHFMGLDDVSNGFVNLWESSDLNVLYNFSREYPSLEFWLFDGAGNQIFYSRSDADDFGWLSELLLGGVADSVKQAKEHGLPLSKLCTKTLLDAVSGIEHHCQQIKVTLSRK